MQHINHTYQPSKFLLQAHKQHPLKITKDDDLYQDEDLSVMRDVSLGRNIGGGLSDCFNTPIAQYLGKLPFCSQGGQVSSNKTATSWQSSGLSEKNCFNKGNKEDSSALQCPSSYSSPNQYILGGSSRSHSTFARAFGRSPLPLTILPGTKDCHDPPSSSQAREHLIPEYSYEVDNDGYQYLMCHSENKEQCISDFLAFNGLGPHSKNETWRQVEDSLELFGDTTQQSRRQSGEEQLFKGGQEQFQEDVKEDLQRSPKLKPSLKKAKNTKTSDTRNLSTQCSKVAPRITKKCSLYLPPCSRLISHHQTRLEKNLNQAYVLHDAFKNVPCWSKELMSELAQRLSLTESQVYKWRWDRRFQDDTVYFKQVKAAISKRDGGPIFKVEQVKERDTPLFSVQRH
ncbi:hypothetical protein FGO68_gene4844 [Halteria grandinella]|uniref:Homeobox domain-containing protein n=1 Tax=Halteria grandinella TaxID=5974 RepID=A0A8J8T3M6_HALGN|nr:hypothetical protein FGO68_gene4844 [Halteria grandinella]